MVMTVIPKFSRNLTALGLLLTALIFLGHGHLPTKRVVIHPGANSSPILYGYIDTVSGQSSYWIDQQANEWGCSYKPDHLYGCGWQLYDPPQETDGINLAAFDAIELELSYSGPASRLRAYLRNFNTAYSVENDANSSKYMSATFPVSELSGPVRLDLHEFSVAIWWLRQWYVPRQWSQVEFDNITNIGVDILTQGDHRVQINKITLVGRWLSTKTLLFVILGFWMTVFLLEGLLRFYQLYKTSKRDSQKLHLLQAKQRTLEEENQILATLADTDPLTNVLNRSGLQAHIETTFKNPVGVSLVLLDIDHFKRINDSLGHDAGDRILKEFAALIKENLREEDVLARWGGEEFIVLCRERSLAKLHSLADKLRAICAGHSFSAGRAHVTVSVGLAQAHEDDAFEESFKRADSALYRAKHNGRNRVEFEPR